MIVETKKKLIFDRIAKLKEKNFSIGFVPTMGALHQGHLSLIETSNKQNQYTVVSIFVNPTQFNDPEDFKKYPRNINDDLKKIEEVGCDFVFTPSPEEMYPETDIRQFDIGFLAEVMEGKYRPGHFNGVLQIVSKLFDCIPATKAYFGEKDFQQLAIIKWFVKTFSYNIEIIPCPTVREADGLAMSSRNLLLSVDERKIAPFIYDTLKKVNVLKNYHSVADVKNWVLNELIKYQQFKPEYFEIAFEENLIPVNDWSEFGTKRAFIATWLGKVRLIDNIKIE
jgi:pantoate--beta-alanine ligase